MEQSKDKASAPLNQIEERKKLGFNTTQRKYILRIEQFHLEEKLELINKLKDTMEQNRNQKIKSLELIELIKSMTPEQKNELAAAIKSIILIAESKQTEMTSPKK